MHAACARTPASLRPTARIPARLSAARQLAPTAGPRAARARRTASGLPPLAAASTPAQAMAPPATGAKDKQVRVCERERKGEKGGAMGGGEDGEASLLEKSRTSNSLTNAPHLNPYVFSLPSTPLH